MIIYYNWIVRKRYSGVTSTQTNCDGWYLFGIIPLYVRKFVRES